LFVGKQDGHFMYHGCWVNESNNVQQKDFIRFCIYVYSTISER